MQLLETSPATVIWSWAMPASSCQQLSRDVRAPHALRERDANSSRHAARCASNVRSQHRPHAALPANGGTRCLRGYPNCDNPCGKDRRPGGSPAPGAHVLRDPAWQSRVWHLIVVYLALRLTETSPNSGIHDACIPPCFVFDVLTA